MAATSEFADGSEVKGGTQSVQRGPAGERALQPVRLWDCVNVRLRGQVDPCIPHIADLERRIARDFALHGNVPLPAIGGYRRRILGRVRRYCWVSQRSS